MNRTFSRSILLTVNNIICFGYVEETSPLVTGPKICLIEKNLIIFFFGGVGIFCYVSLPIIRTNNDNLK